MYTIASMISLYHANTATTAAGRPGMRAANVFRCDVYYICDIGVVNTAYTRHRSEYSVGARGYHASRRVLGRLGFMIASLIALHHASTTLVVPGRSRACAANVSQCRKRSSTTPMS